MDPDLERRIRASYAAFMRGDLEGAVQDMAEDPEFVNPEYALEGGVLEGRKAVTEAFESVHEWMVLESIDVEEVLEGPAGVLVMVRLRGEGRGSGVPVDVTYAHVLEYRDHRAQRFTWYETREEGLAAIGAAAPGG